MFLRINESNKVEESLIHKAIINKVILMQFLDNKISLFHSFILLFKVKHTYRVGWALKLYINPCK